MTERADGGFRCNCPQCQARYDRCPAARELEEIITSLTRERDEARAECDDARQILIAWDKDYDGVCEDRDRLRALLRQCEWTGFPVGLHLSHPHFGSVCPRCQRQQRSGHTPDCEMMAALEGHDGAQ